MGKVVNDSDFLKTGLKIGLITILISNALLYYCMSKGFYSVETHLMIFVPGITFMSVFLFFTRSILNAFDFIKLFIFCYIVYTLFDCLVFWADNSISIYFASFLSRIAISEGDSIKYINSYSNLPFSVQSMLVTAVIFIISAIILFILKKIKN